MEERMYKVASDRRQSALHRGRLSDWVGGKEVLSHEDRLRQLQEGTKILEQRILDLPRKSAERKRLGQEKSALQAELHELKKTQKRPPRGWKMFFVDEAYRILSDSQFEMIKRAAVRECELYAARFPAPMDKETSE